MAKRKATKAKKATKKKSAMAKVTCPMCNCSCSVKMPKSCKTSMKCPECDETMKAKDCCVFCDYSNKTCLACK